MSSFFSEQGKEPQKARSSPLKPLSNGMMPQDRAFEQGLGLTWNSSVPELGHAETRQWRESPSSSILTPPTPHSPADVVFASLWESMQKTIFGEGNSLRVRELSSAPGFTRFGPNWVPQSSRMREEQTRLEGRRREMVFLEACQMHCLQKEGQISAEEHRRRLLKLLNEEQPWRLQEEHVSTEELHRRLLALVEKPLPVPQPSFGSVNIDGFPLGIPPPEGFSEQARRIGEQGDTNRDRTAITSLTFPWETSGSGPADRTLDQVSSSPPDRQSGPLMFDYTPREYYAHKEALCESSTLMRSRMSFDIRITRAKRRAKEMMREATQDYLEELKTIRQTMSTCSSSNPEDKFPIGTFTRTLDVLREGDGDDGFTRALSVITDYQFYFPTSQKLDRESSTTGPDSSSRSSLSDSMSYARISPLQEPCPTHGQDQEQQQQAITLLQDSEEDSSFMEANFSPISSPTVSMLGFQISQELSPTQGQDQQQR